MELSELYKVKSYVPRNALHAEESFLHALFLLVCLTQALLLAGLYIYTVKPFKSFYLP